MKQGPSGDDDSCLRGRRQGYFQEGRESCLEWRAAREFPYRLNFKPFNIVVTDHLREVFLIFF
jgi:hypothetical protein